MTGDEGEVEPLRQTTLPKGDKVVVRALSLVQSITTHTIQASYNFTLQGKNPLFIIESYPVEHSYGEQMCNSG